MKTETSKNYTSCNNELAKDEIWLGNTKGTEIPKHYKSLKTIRVGNQAYDIKGNKLDINYCRPLILNKSELEAYEKIYAARMENARYKNNT